MKPEPRDQPCGTSGSGGSILSFATSVHNASKSSEVYMSIISRLEMPISAHLRLEQGPTPMLSLRQARRQLGVPSRMATPVYEAEVLAKLLESRLNNEQLGQVAKLAPNATVPAFCRQALAKYEAQPAVWSGAFELVKKRQAILAG